MKTQDALSLLIALEERVARVYFHFFRTFRTDLDVARCWWEIRLAPDCAPWPCCGSAACRGSAPDLMTLLSR